MTTTRQHWTRWARCRAEDPELWFSDHAEDQADAKRLCNSCPVRGACLDYMLAAEGNAAASNRYGIAAGLTPSGRRRAYEHRQQAAGLTVTEVKPRGPGRDLAPCGTEAAQRRHKRLGETCATCHTPRPDPLPVAYPRRTA